MKCRWCHIRIVRCTCGLPRPHWVAEQDELAKATPRHMVQGLDATTPTRRRRGQAMINHHAIRERHSENVEMHEGCGPLGCRWAAIGALLDEIDRLHTWDGLMSLVDEHYPVSVFPVELPLGDRDPGPWTLSLLRRIDVLNKMLDDDPRHIIEFRDDGWTIKHPLSCRPHLFDCPVNRAAEHDLMEPPRPFGRYECSASDDGRLLVGEVVDG